MDYAKHVHADAKVSTTKQMRFKLGLKSDLNVAVGAIFLTFSGSSSPGHVTATVELIFTGRPRVLYKVAELALKLVLLAQVRLLLISLSPARDSTVGS